MSLKTIDTITQYLYGTGIVRNILGGAALCFAIQNRNYIHVPIILIFPSAYTGYQAYKHKENIVNWISNQTVKIDYRYILK